MKISMIAQARREMLRAASRYVRNGPGLGNRFLDDVRAGLLAVLEFPNGQPPVTAPYRRKLLRAFSYALIYRCDPDEISIVAVTNFSRRPGYWRRRTVNQDNLQFEHPASPAYSALPSSGVSIP